jgi:hypothetical protein
MLLLDNSYVSLSSPHETAEAKDANSIATPQTGAAGLFFRLTLHNGYTQWR